VIFQNLPPIIHQWVEFLLAAGYTLQEALAAGVAIGMAFAVMAEVLASAIASER
jgi:hypothetical protein